MSLSARKWYDQLRNRALGPRRARDATPEEQAGMEKWREGDKKGALGIFAGSHAVVLESFLAGGGLYYLSQLQSVKDIELFKNNWWLKGLLMLGLGYYLWRRGSAWASAIIASAAATLVQAYNERDKDKKPAASAAPASGFDWEDAGHEDWRLPEGHRRERIGERIAGRVYG